MARSSKRPLEAVNGTYSAMPHSVLDSVAFMGTSHRGRSLLIELMRQHNGINNGHLQLTGPYLKRRGWRSADQIKKAEAELLERQLIIKTRQGGLNLGPNLYAVTWLPISNFVGLDISSKDYHRGAYLCMDQLPAKDSASAGHKKTVPEVRRNAIRRTVRRNSDGFSDSSIPRTDAVPFDGTARPPAIPYDGSKTGLSSIGTIPHHGNNEYNQSPTAHLIALNRPPVVGAPGRSGKRASKATTC